MRACFLGQNICNLGYDVATLQAPPLVIDYPVRPDSEAENPVSPDPNMGILEGVMGSPPVANPPRPDA